MSRGLTCVVNGFNIMYDRECPMEMICDIEQVTAQIGEKPKNEEKLQVKVLYQGVQNCPISLRIELMSANNCNFLYIHECDFDEFQSMRIS